MERRMNACYSLFQEKWNSLVIYGSLSSDCMQSTVHPCLCFCPLAVLPSDGYNKPGNWRLLPRLLQICTQNSYIWSQLNCRCWNVLEGLQDMWKYKCQLRNGSERLLYAVSLKQIWKTAEIDIVPEMEVFKVGEERLKIKTHEWHKDREEYNLLQEIILWAGTVKGGRGELRKVSEKQKKGVIVPTNHTADDKRS